MDAVLSDLSARVGHALRQQRLILATAESCTGGWVAQAITHVAGSSVWFERGFVTYANDAKIEMLGVNPETIAGFGAVSAQTVMEMAHGALANSHATVSLAISGIAGPAGSLPGKPVGTVYFAWCKLGGELQSACCCFAGDREAIRRQAVLYALDGLLARLK
jgi:nicotinamide-nucleotide amidase